jgi:hypothetical protein
MHFDPQDPFPLLNGGMVPYAEEKAHSERVDAWLGLKIPEAEARIPPGQDEQERWERKGPAVFLTPYSEIRKILGELAPGPGDTVVDLGAGYGRMGFVLHAHFPGVKFLGYELVAERVAEGRRVLRERGCANAELIQRDLWAEGPAAAAYYFLYDYGARAAIEKTLGDLRAIAQGRPLTLVGRGRAVRDAVERGHPWLGAVVAPTHRPNYSIYRSS